MAAAAACPKGAYGSGVSCSTSSYGKASIDLTGTPFMIDPRIEWFTVNTGKADVLTEGKDVTLVAWGSQVSVASCNGVRAAWGAARRWRWGEVGGPAATAARERRWL